MKTIALSLSMFLYCFTTDLRGQAQTYSFEQVDSLYQVSARPIVVFIHTDWCRYCEVMEQTTLKDKQIIQNLNEQFYFIRLNAETKRDISFRGHTFSFRPTGRHTGLHELAQQLGTIEGQLSYPTVCILNKKHEIIFQYDGFLKAKTLRKVLKKM